MVLVGPRRPRKILECNIFMFKLDVWNSEFRNFHEILTLASPCEERSPNSFADANFNALRLRHGHFESHVNCGNGIVFTGK